MRILTPMGIGSTGSVVNGGTGISSYTIGDLLYASGTATLSKLADVAAGSVLASGGVGVAPSWSATPTLTTSLTTPLVLGGTAVSSSIILKSTSGVGSSDAIVFQVGNNGATEAARFLTSGYLGIGLTTPLSKLTVSYAPAAGNPSTTDANWGFALVSTTTQAVDTGPSLTFKGQSGNGIEPYTFGSIQGSKNSATAADYSSKLTFYTTYPNGGTLEHLRLDEYGNTTITANVATALTVPATFTLTNAAHTALTASTERFDANFNSNRTIQWATGALTTQRFNLFQAPTIAFVGASTVTDVATVAISGAPVKGTNATVTQSHALLIQAGNTSTAAKSFGLTCNTPVGGTANYAAQFLGGNVGIGNGAPGALLDLGLAGTTAGVVRLAGLTSGNLTLAVAAAAGTNTLTFPGGTTDFSATGGTSFVVQQASVGAALTVSQLAASALSNGTTGSGSVVLATSPTFVTDLTSPLHIGGTAVSSTLILKSTSGVGSSDAIVFQVGNNGATEAARFLTSGYLGIGITTPLSKFTVSYAPAAGVPTATDANWGASIVSSTTAAVDTGPSLAFKGQTGNGVASYPFAHIQGSKDSAVASDYGSKLTFYTTRLDGGILEHLRIDQYGNMVQTGSTVGNAVTVPATFTILNAAHTALTASTERFDTNFNSARTIQWATGALTTQRFNLFQAPTIAFVGASTVTDVATVAITGAPKAGTNTTQSNTHGLLIQAGAVTAGTKAFGLTCNAPTGATANYSAQFLGGNVGIGNSAPTVALDVTGAILASTTIQSAGIITPKNATTDTAGGAQAIGLGSSAAAFGIYWGSGAPTISAAKGSLYLRTDGTGAADRAYINTNASTTWTAIVSVA